MFCKASDARPNYTGTTVITIPIKNFRIILLLIIQSNQMLTCINKMVGIFKLIIMILHGEWRMMPLNFISMIPAPSLIGLLNLRIPFFSKRGLVFKVLDLLAWSLCPIIFHKVFLENLPSKLGLKWSIIVLHRHIFLL